MLTRLKLAWIAFTKPKIVKPALSIYSDLINGSKQIEFDIKFNDGSVSTEVYELTHSINKPVTQK